MPLISSMPFSSMGRGAKVMPVRLQGRSVERRLSPKKKNLPSDLPDRGKVIVALSAHGGSRGHDCQLALQVSLYGSDFKVCTEKQRSVALILRSIWLFESA